jgi:heme O synthase-like polyprenyltransferase
MRGRRFPVGLEPAATTSGGASRQLAGRVTGVDSMSTKTASRILLSALILGPWALSGYFIVAGYVLYGVILFVLGVVFLLWIWKPWKRWKRTHHTETKRRSDTVKHS